MPAGLQYSRSFVTYYYFSDTISVLIDRSQRADHNPLATSVVERHQQPLFSRGGTVDIWKSHGCWNIKKRTIWSLNRYVERMIKRRRQRCRQPIRINSKNAHFVCQTSVWQYETVGWHSQSDICKYWIICDLLLRQPNGDFLTRHNFVDGFIQNEREVNVEIQTDLLPGNTLK